MYCDISSYPQFLFFFFLMTRPPPSSTLFPYPTLFRSVPLGASVTLCGPPTLVPSAWRCGMAPFGTAYEPDLDQALAGADAVIALRLQKERQQGGLDRKSTRLNSSHSQISYAVFCLKKK